MVVVQSPLFLGYSQGWEGVLDGERNRWGCIRGVHALKMPSMSGVLEMGRLLRGSTANLGCFWDARWHCDGVTIPVGQTHVAAKASSWWEKRVWRVLRGVLVWEMAFKIPLLQDHTT